MIIETVQYYANEYGFTFMSLSNHHLVISKISLYSLMSQMIINPLQTKFTDI